MKTIITAFVALLSVSAFAEIHVIGAKRVSPDMYKNCNGTLEEIHLGATATYLHTDSTRSTGCHFILTGGSASYGASLSGAIGKRLEIATYDAKTGTATLIIR